MEIPVGDGEGAAEVNRQQFTETLGGRAGMNHPEGSCASQSVRKGDGKMSGKALIYLYLILKWRRINCQHIN